MTYVDYPREKLIKNIKKRIDKMFDLGAIKEVKKFNLIKINKLIEQVTSQLQYNYFSHFTFPVVNELKLRTAILKKIAKLSNKIVG